MSAKSNYPQVRLGANGPLVSAIGYGAMGTGGTVYGPTDESKALETLTHAADLGVTFWDTSDAYGASHTTIGKWFTSTGRRKEIFLATKFGSLDTSPGATNLYKLNSKPSFIKMKVEEALKELETDYIDLYYQHRIDPEVPVEVVMETLLPFVQQGKIKYIGLSEASIDVLRRAKSVPGAGEKLIAVQMEFSPFELEIEHSGFVDVAKELGVGIVAYSPFGRGIMTGQIKSRTDLPQSDIRHILPRFSDEHFPATLALVEKFNTVAQKYNATPGQITLAWILKRHSDFIPIPGTRSAARLDEIAASKDVKLSAEDFKVLNEGVESADIKGGGYPPAFAFLMNRDCIPLSEWKGE